MGNGRNIIKKYAWIWNGRCYFLWHTTIFPPYFVAGAVFSGFAMVNTLLIIMRKVSGLEDYITVQHIELMRHQRARDVQMLFADVSTGARSPSLVRQGQIDELISQKPEQRRRILEEAAGISGFHVRRHEAELRLNAAHTNLERLDDVLKELSSQMRSLKKQAREANRYKSLSEEIRNAQSVVLAVKYETISEQLDESKKQFNDAIRKHQEAIKEVASLNSNEISLQSELAPLREKVTVDSAKLQRLLIEMEGLDKEILRQKERSGELSRFIDSTASQLARENDILKDLKDLLSRHGDNEINIKRKQGLENSISNRANDLIKNNTLLSDFSNIYSKKENIENYKFRQ